MGGLGSQEQVKNNRFLINKISRFFLGKILKKTSGQQLKVTGHQDDDGGRLRLGRGVGGGGVEGELYGGIRLVVVLCEIDNIGL